ncbi:MAG: DUF447 family protein [Thermoplasmata archaeon]
MYIIIEAKSRSMRLSSKAIYECVLTTVCPSGRINSASIGVNVTEKDGKFVIKTNIYEGTDSARNLLYYFKNYNWNNDKKNKKRNEDRSKISISFITREDTDLLVHAALKGHSCEENEFDISEYEYSDGIPYHKRGYISAICRLVKLKRRKKVDQLGEAFFYECSFFVEKWLPGNAKFKIEPISRACGALIEASIEATRLSQSKKFAKKERLLLIERFLSIAKKTGSESDRKIANFISKRIKEIKNR